MRKFFAAVIGSLRLVKGQYIALEQALQGINKELKVEPLSAMARIKKLPKAQDMADLQVWVDCLLKENRELKTHVEERESRLNEVEELKGRTKAM